MTKMQGPELTIAVIGDIHYQWEAADNRALENLGVDLALFVGDFGNEVVPIVALIAQLSLPKAVVLGNHDAWYSASPWGRKRCPYDRLQEDRVQTQLELLQQYHVGYGHLDFPQLGVSVLGGRPFSWGGSEWKNKEFLEDLYQVRNFQDSCDRIVQEGLACTENTILALGHNGPAGLGDTPESLCGRDWQPLGGDHGDPDFGQALQRLTTEHQKNIALVTFGHMHHNLRHRSDRLRTRSRQLGQTLYLNGACTPRWQEFHGEKLRHFSLATLRSGVISQVRSVWANEQGDLALEEQLTAIAVKV